MKRIYNLEQLKKLLSTLPIGVEAVDAITEFAQLLQNRLDHQTNRCNTAAQLLGHDIIDEYMDDE